MKPLDNELRSLFKRKEPPEGFAERVLARLDQEPVRLTFAQQVLAPFRRPTLRWVAVGAVVCVMAVLGVARHQRQQRMRAQAEQEAILALRITSTELDAALERAQRATVQALKVPKNPSETRSNL